ncbi:MAG: trehalose-6-phosphate synthase [Sulfurimonas sp.]|uniref:alpha,alpha-trehalose-phosphate synthase (UDP-forming) n=1 Tax=Sulfurimonas sp. TaxID=2022749 RepID=UPI0028CC4975|nr:trehalose-6-phosphate synthase [Sulfurimonas sp.]MDT8337615.1 trehalose-6-phosphate synthase [Sulfurimonas sp.]
MMKNRENTRLILVSNRLPIVLKKIANEEYQVQSASGGLVTAMTPILKRDGGLWIGWAGNYSEESVEVEKLLKKEAEKLNYEYRSVDITLNEYKLYYKGFSNEVLWPLFHNVSVFCNFVPKYYEAFKKVNKKFAKTVIDELIDGDFIWVHDYHLINMAKELREEGIKNRVVFFLHIPFPPVETFNRLPWRLEIVEAMLSYDLIGFQTALDKKNFLEAVVSLIKRAVIEDEKLEISKITIDKKEHQVGVFPISIDYDEFHDRAKSKRVSKEVEKIKKEYHHQKIMLGVDRLDYSKGILQKLRAYWKLLDENHDLHKKVKLIQIIVPSRENIIKYIHLKSDIEQLVSEINGEFTQPGWIPIQYCYYSLNNTELLAYYRASDIAMVTPLRDGMNLVAKEYCATNINKNGVLILSEFAGTKDQFKDNALLVNPFDENSVVEAIKKALLMDEKEKQRRMKNMQKIVKEFDIYWWVDRFLKASKI